MRPRLNVLLFFTALFLQPANSQAQEPESTAAATEEFSPVVDSLAYPQALTRIPYNLFAFILRFSPSGGREVQIVVLAQTNGRVQCRVYRPTRGDSFGVLGSGSANDGTPAASEVSVEQVDLTAQETLAWRDRFFAAASKQERVIQRDRREEALHNTTSISLDGSLYRLWYRDSDNVQYWRILGGWLQERSVFSMADDLTNWMDTVRCIVIKEERPPKKGN